MWHVSSRSGVATLRTAIHLLLTTAAVPARLRGCVADASVTGTRASAFVLTTGTGATATAAAAGAAAAGCGADWCAGVSIIQPATTASDVCPATMTSSGDRPPSNTLTSASVRTTRRVLTYLPSMRIFGWRRGVVVSGVRRMNEVNARRARLVPGWVTVFGMVWQVSVAEWLARLTVV